jgi:hypothetical protein
MGVNVDPPRRDELPVCVDLALGRTGLAADLSDAVAIDGNVAGEAFRAFAVDDRAAPDDDIMHRA